MFICASPTEASAIRELAGETGHFEVVHETADVRGVVPLCRRLRPDVVVLDSQLSPATERLAFELAVERPLPVLLLVDGSEEAPAGGNDTIRLFRLPKQRLYADDPVGQRFARTRLTLLAAAAKEPKRTVGADGLRDLLDELYDEVDAPPDVAALVERPLDLIVLAAASGTVRTLEAIARMIQAVRVPVLLAADPRIDPRDVETALGPLARTPLAEPKALRRLDGVQTLATSIRFQIADRDRLATGPGPLDPEALIDSMAALGETGLTIAIGDELEPAARRLEALGGNAAFVGEANLDLVQLTPTEVAWVLGRALPRRV